MTVRQVKRLLYALKKHGDKAVIHGLRGAPSNRRIAEKIQQKAIQILSGEEYAGFGPTLASECLASRHRIVASRETVRTWMTEAGLWKPGKAEDRTGSRMAAAAEPVWGVGTVGHQRA